MRNALLVFDFDGTIADTFSPSPNEMDVAKACALAVGEVFGKDLADIYHTDLGGLQNRSPRELIETLFHAAHKNGISVPLFDSHRHATQQFVEAKLAHFVISTDWPKLFPGIKELFQKAALGDLPVDVAIAASAHTEFVKETFRVHDVPLPPILITSDTVEEIDFPHRPKYKPHPFQLALTHHTWLGERDYVQQSLGAFATRREKGRMGYVGDDLKKDGGLAYVGRLPFVLVPHTNPNQRVNPDNGQLQATIPELTELLLKKHAILEAGGSLTEVLCNRPDEEIFPPLTESEKPYQQWMEGIHPFISRERSF